MSERDRRLALTIVLGIALGVAVMALLVMNADAIRQAAGR